MRDTIRLGIPMRDTGCRIFGLMLTDTVGWLVPQMSLRSCFVYNADN